MLGVFLMSTRISGFPTQARGRALFPPEARPITDPIKGQLANAIINDACFHPGRIRVCRVDLDVVTGKTAGALSRGIVQRSDRTVD